MTRIHVITSSIIEHIINKNIVRCLLTTTWSVIHTAEPLQKIVPEIMSILVHDVTNRVLTKL